MAEAIYDLSARRINGDIASLAEFRGKVLLIVNVASKCGLTPQYAGLESLYARFKDAGLIVLGFPANDFAGQEPGSNEEIQAFCQGTFGVQFPMFSKVVVTGENKDPLYQRLTSALPSAIATKPESFRDELRRYGIQPTSEPEVLWNFEKFIIDRSGMAIARFSPEVLPEDPALLEVIEAALNA